MSQTSEPYPAEGLEALSLHQASQESDIRSSFKRDSTEMELGSMRGGDEVDETSVVSESMSNAPNAVYMTKRRRTGELN